MYRLLFVCVVVLFFSGCTSVPPADAVDTLKPAKIMGKWYEIARSANWFESESGSDYTVSFATDADGEMSMSSHFVKENGGDFEIKATASQPDPLKDPGKIRMTFLKIFFRDYWITCLDPDYRYMVVLYPSGGDFWILSRTPTLPPDEFVKIIDQLTKKKYDISKLVKCPHSN